MAADLVRSRPTRLQAFGHALRGVARLLRTQPHARFHALATVVVVALGVVLNLSTWRWAAVVGAIALVVVAEALNTAVEFAVDLASPDWHELARDAKDVAAGAVLLASIAAVVLGVLAFAQPLHALWLLTN
jgi:diacylglycerol kinase (ATP)